MVDLPPEIWHYIAKYISEDDMKCLYSVNRVFFDIAMGMRYREISIVSLNGPTQGQEFSMEKILSSEMSILVRYIQSIKICSSLKRYYKVPWKNKAYQPTAFLKPRSHVPWGLDDWESFPRSYPANIFVWARAKLQLASKTTASRDTHRVEQGWEVLITKLHAVKKLTILSDNVDKPPWFGLNLLPCNLDITKTMLGPSSSPAAGMTTPGLWQNLSSLTLMGNVDDIAHLSHQLHHTSLALPSLTELSLDLRRITYRNDREEYVTDSDIASIASFLNSLSHQLSVLHVRCIQNIEDLRLYDLLSALDTFTELHGLSLYMTLERGAQVKPIYEFLERHRHSIKNLSLYLITVYLPVDDFDFYPQKVFEVVYPHLEHLDLNLLYTENPLSGLAPALRNSGGNIKTLSLKDVPLTVEDICYLINSLGEAASGKIKTLKFALHCGFWEDFLKNLRLLLDFLCHWTPSLEYLSIVIQGSYTSVMFDRQEQLADFSAHLRSQKNVYHACNIRELHLSSRYNSERTPYLEQLPEILRECIPGADVFPDSEETKEWYLYGHDWSYF